MYLDLHTIIDLIINTLKNCFLIEDTKFEKIKVGKETILLIVKADNEDRKYEIAIRYDKKGKDNDSIEVEISSIWLSLLDMCEGFPIVTSSFTANALTEFENSLRRTIRNCWFYKEELNELL